MWSSLFITLFTACLVLPVHGTVHPDYYKAPALKGDGVFSLLRRYQLVDQNCNLQAFYSLNNLSKQDQLLAGKTYTLPIYVYEYDGNSIRSTINNPDYDYALTIAAYNNNLTEKGVKSGYYQKDKILWVPLHLADCDPAEQQSTSKKEFITESLLGKTHERIEIVDHSLKGKIYYIISGHGGPDPGTQATMSNSAAKLCEDEYAYDVALRLYRNLLSHGATAYMIIQDANDGIRDFQILKADRDEKCLGKSPLPLNQKVRLNQRTQAINHLYKTHKKKGANEQYAISIHIDSRSSKQRQDVYFYHYKKSKSGKKLAHQILNTFKEKYKINRRTGHYEGTVQTRDLYVLKYTRPTAVFVELANIQNPSDQKRIIYPDNRQALADWLYLGLTHSSE